MSELVEFLSARLDEDERIAHGGFSHPGRWVRVAVPGMPDGIPNGISCTAVLREVEAKRQILALAEESTEAARSTVGDDYMMAENYMTSTLKILALPYSDHPDYQETWRA